MLDGPLHFVHFFVDGPTINSLAIARPSPVDAPVINTTCLLKPTSRRAERFLRFFAYTEVSRKPGGRRSSLILVKNFTFMSSLLSIPISGKMRYLSNKNIV